MKRLTPEQIDDVAILNQIANNPARALHQHPQTVAAMIAQYARYTAAQGNAAHPQVPVELQLTPALQTLLKGQYSAPPEELAFIDRIRGSSTDACPMCGGTNSSTIDHIFPQGRFAEFAFFSQNLVPACGCNTLRKAALRGDQPGERILHPYFDDCLAERLVRANITSNQGYESPDIELLILVPPAHPARPALDFHLREIVLKTFIRRHWIQLWGKLRYGPETYFKLPAGEVTAQGMTEAATRKRQDRDDELGTPNNWDSMLFAGIEANEEARDYLRQRIVSLRQRGLQRALD